MAKQTGDLPDEAIGPECPDGLRHIYRWFLELSRARSVAFAVSPITWSDIDAWSRFNNCRLTRFELDCLFALDRAFLKLQR